MFRVFSTVAAGVAILACAFPTPSRAQAPTIEQFVDHAAVSHASLSPSGRYLAWVERNGDDNVVRIRNLDDGHVWSQGAGGSRDNFGGVFVDFLTWKTDERLLIGLTRLELRRRGGRENGSIRSYRYGRIILAFDYDGSDLVKLVAPRSDDVDPGEVLDTLQDDPDHILMTYDTGSALNVARVDIHTGESERILQGGRRVLDYITDNSGAVVGRYAYRGTGRTLMLEALNPDGSWSEVYRIRRDEIRDLPDYQFLGATAEPGKVYVALQPETAEADGARTAAIHTFDFATRTMGPAIWSNDRYDVSSIVVDADTRELLAGCYWTDIYQCDFTNPRENAVMNAIRRFMGDGWSVSVVSQARDNTRWLIRARAPWNPGEYYVFDTEQRHMDFVGAVYRGLPEDQLGRMRRIDYVAGDGLSLFGYLTRPPGAGEDARPPLVVMPHGGPEMRDHLAYDTWVQFLATRGYQVFQPNFRGSSGMGRAFAEAGYRQWGGLMQDDVTAGVEHLIEAGLADRNQVCIVGASYGGYAALYGAATQPDLYRCAVSISGVSDLVSIMRWERGQDGADSDAYEYWLKSIGDPSTDRERLERVSPIRHAATWRTPLLLVHGDEDGVVPISQSRDMERALRRAGKEVRLVTVEGADHSDWTRSQDTTLLRELEDFLALHLPVGATARPSAEAPGAVTAAP